MPLVMGLVMTCRGSGPIVPPAREIVVGGSAKQTNGRYTSDTSEAWTFRPTNSRLSSTRWLIGLRRDAEADSKMFDLRYRRPYGLHLPQ
jgi:hypothetical protein